MSQACPPTAAGSSLFAWLTLANGDETGFANADTQAVAGRLNREYVDREEREIRQLTFRCWPRGRTSDIPLEVPPPPTPVARPAPQSRTRRVPVASIGERGI